MRVAIIRDGIVENVVELPGDSVIQSDKGSVVIPAVTKTRHPGGDETTEQYEAAFSDGGGALFVATDAAGPGWTFDGTHFAAP